MNAHPQRVLIVTGSGISAESGIPTFRGKDGYWRNLDPTKLATTAAFENNPSIVWEWYRERRERIQQSQPNAAHNALVKLAEHCRDFLLLTQNVDDLHARAEWTGRRLDSNRIVQIHGDIFRTRCSKCDYERRDPGQDTAGVPRCPRCSAALRPGVVWFDEELDRDEVRRVETFLERGACDVVVVIGTTALFDYIVRWTLDAKGAKGRLIEINPEQTSLSSYANETIRAAAATVLPELVDRLI
jgi:NAD-dependent deacetylase